MLRALIGKEWRQLRMLRWSGLVIGLLTPLLLMTFAGDRSWLVGSFSGASAATVVQDLTPMMLGMAIWPMLTLMVVVSALTADRAAGTDAFLLQRPVSATNVWAARLLVSVGAVLTLVVAHTAVWWLWVRLVGNPAAFDESEALGRLLGEGAVFTVAAFTAGAAAAAFVRTPMQGMLLGLVLTAIPIALGSLLSGPLFFGYKINDVRLGFAIPLLLVVGYVVASFRTECRGEPAGRGRIRRGVTWVVAGLVAMPLLLGASAPLVMRLDAKLNLGNTTVLASRSGGVGFGYNIHQRAGWLIDFDRRERLRFAPPPVLDAAWSRDGSRLALLHSAGGAGRMLADPVLEILDRRGRRVGQPVACAECRPWWSTGLVWSGDRIVLPGFVEGGEGLLIFDASTGARRTVGIPRPVYLFNLLEARDSGSLFVLRLVRRQATEEDETEAGRPTMDGILHPLDVDGGSLGPGRMLSDIGSNHDAPRALSPDGRRWLRFPRGDAPMRIVDLETGEQRTLPARKAAWLAGGALAWLKPRDDDRLELLVGDPGEGRVVQSLPRSWVTLEASPDGRKLLVSVREPGEEWRFARSVYDPVEESWQELSLPDDDRGMSAVQWAGPERLAVVDRGSLGVLDPRGSEGVVALIGRPRG